MLKKIIRFGIFACLTVGFLCASAQDQDENTTKKKYKHEYPRYGFWSNWSFGINAEYQHQLSAGGYDPTWTGFTKFGETSLAGLGIDLEKELSPMWNFRFRVQAPSLSLLVDDWNKINWYAFFLENKKDRGGWLVQPMNYIGVDFKFDMIDALGGYKPDRKFSWYLSIGGGATVKTNKLYPSQLPIYDSSATGTDIAARMRNLYPLITSTTVQGDTVYVDRDDVSIIGAIDNNSSITIADTINGENTLYHDSYGRVGVFGTVGTGLSFKLCKHATFFVESDMKIISDAPAFWIKGAVHHLHLTTTAGFLFHFGVTGTDRELIAQRTLLTQENFDSMEEQINDLEKDLNTSKKAEQRLENRINELEGQVTQLTALANANEQPKPSTTSKSEEVQRIINQIKSEQITYYAMPFSVLFGNDQWTVPEEQYRKIQAIANVLEKDTTVRIKLIGFCDYTASEEYNLKLSEKRVNEVKRILVEKYGVNENRLETDFKGKNVPFGEEHFSINRRVSFYRIID